VRKKKVYVKFEEVLNKKSLDEVKLKPVCAVIKREENRIEI